MGLRRGQRTGVQWCYGVQTVGDEAIDGIIHSFYEGVVGPYWPPERRHIESGYRDLPFPFATIATPAFDMTARWSLPALLGYFRSWSATAGYRRAHGVDPVIALDERLRGAWGTEGATRLVRWPLSLRVGRI